MRARAAELGVDLSAAAVLDPKTSELCDRFAEQYAELRKHKGVTVEQARETIHDVSYFGTMLVYNDMVDGMVSGARHTTAHTVRPSFEIIKTRPGAKIVSSVFLMALEDRVLVYGQSGGGAKTSVLMAMPGGKGLFQRAGVMSGSALRMMPPEMASATAKRLLDALEIAPGDVRKLQQVPWTTLLETQAGLEAADRARGEAPRSFAPVVDGITLPRHPWDPDAPSISADVPMIVSSVLDERSYRMGDFAMDEAGLLAFAKERLGERAADAVAAYRAEDPDAKPFLLAARMDSDLTFRKGAFAQAELKARQGGAPVWTYLWTEPSPAVDGRFGAVHGIDVAPSLYNTRGALNGSSPSANELAAAIAGSWAAFAANGDPNNERVPEWKPYSAPRRTTMIFDQDLRVEDDPRAEFRKYWR